MNEYGVEPSHVLLHQIGLLWTKSYLEADNIPADGKARVNDLAKELKASIALHEG
tara:strand:+ start:800 stop:964 length:165 start_codon:yes stop_codon:yes gene_type:complete